MGAAKPGVMPPGAPPTRGESGDKVNPWYMRYPGTYPAPTNSSFTCAAGEAGGLPPRVPPSAAGAEVDTVLGAGDGAGAAGAGAGLGSAGTGVGLGAGGSSAAAGTLGDAIGAGSGDTAASADGPASGRASNFRIRSAQITPRPKTRLVRASYQVTGRVTIVFFGPTGHRLGYSVVESMSRLLSCLLVLGMGGASACIGVSQTRSAGSTPGAEPAGWVRVLLTMA
jgi:hypothetical protein